jgi:hypothetical protein
MRIVSSGKKWVTESKTLYLGIVAKASILTRVSNVFFFDYAIWQWLHTSSKSKLIHPKLNVFGEFENEPSQGENVVDKTVSRRPKRTLGCHHWARPQSVLKVEALWSMFGTIWEVNTGYSSWVKKMAYLSIVRVSTMNDTMKIFPSARWQNSYLEQAFDDHEHVLARMKRREWGIVSLSMMKAAKSMPAIRGLLHIPPAPARVSQPRFNAKGCERWQTAHSVSKSDPFSRLTCEAHPGQGDINRRIRVVTEKQICFVPNDWKRPEARLRITETQ